MTKSDEIGQLSVLVDQAAAENIYCKKYSPSASVRAKQVRALSDRSHQERRVELEAHRNDDPNDLLP